MDGGADLEMLGRDALDALEGGTGQRWVRNREAADGGDCAALLRDAVRPRREKYRMSVPASSTGTRAACLSAAAEPIGPVTVS